MTLLNQLRSAFAKHAAYRRTVFELRGISQSLAEDVAIYPGDAKRIAREAIYG